MSIYHPSSISCRALSHTQNIYMHIIHKYKNMSGMEGVRGESSTSMRVNEDDWYDGSACVNVFFTCKCVLAVRADACVCVSVCVESCTRVHRQHDSAFIYIKKVFLEGLRLRGSGDMNF